MTNAAILLNATSCISLFASYRSRGRDSSAPPYVDQHGDPSKLR
jgi:hypothetical protein